MAPTNTRKNTIAAVGISSTAILRNKYGVPQRNHTRANLPQPTFVN